MLNIGEINFYPFINEYYNFAMKSFREHTVISFIVLIIALYVLRFIWELCLKLFEWIWSGFCNWLEWILRLKTLNGQAFSLAALAYFVMVFVYEFFFDTVANKQIYAIAFVCSVITFFLFKWIRYAKLGILRRAKFFTFLTIYHKALQDKHPEEVAFQLAQQHADEITQAFADAENIRITRHVDRIYGSDLAMMREASEIGYEEHFRKEEKIQ